MKPLGDNWKPIKDAPTTGVWVEVYAPGVEELPDLYMITCYHPRAGWNVDEFRDVTHWRPLPQEFIETKGL